MSREVTLKFLLSEEVTPFFFAQKVAEQLGSVGALRIGESVVETESNVKITIANLTPPVPMLPWLEVSEGPDV